ncbi:MAG TPA: ATP-grasp domain-containing protein [Ktedonobacterales bacterium]|jgi:biotin carboxylase
MTNTTHPAGAAATFDPRAPDPCETNPREADPDALDPHGCAAVRDQEVPVPGRGDAAGSRKRVLMLAAPATYRAGAFANAAGAAEVEVLRGVDLPAALAMQWPGALSFDFSDPEAAADAIVAFARDTPLDAILSLDDSAALVAALASAGLGLRHNPPRAALAARDKGVMREALAAGGVPVPTFRRFSRDVDAAGAAMRVGYPCVVKPLRLSGSRGVIRADDPDQFVAAFGRLRRMLESEGGPGSDEILVEDYLPGVEVALEGLLTGGELHVLALFDKPDPLEGPFFEETLYITPSRLTPEVQEAIAEMTARSLAAIGLREGPIHAELRVNERGPWLLEVAARSIGGLCSSVLQFGTDVCLEELILRHAAGMALPELARSGRAAGVMMIPIPRGGVLRGYHGVDEARAVPGVEGVEITARAHYPLVPLPEGASYLGFIFARAETPAEAEAALRAAHACLRFDIAPEIPLIPLVMPVGPHGAHGALGDHTAHSEPRAPGLVGRDARASEQERDA